jgi:type II secretory pathway pseudopilin PulG
MVVVVIIGLLAAITIPAFQRVRERSFASRYVNDFRQFDSAFQRYATENGQWPPQAAAGVVPTGMAGYVPAAYTLPTPMGGSYQWFNSGETVIALMGSQATDAVMQRVDAALDDGNLSTGVFFKIGSAGYGYRLQ